MKLLKISLSLSAFLFLIACGNTKDTTGTEDSEQDYWFTGIWEGTGSLVQGEGTFKVSVNAGDGSEISAKYPSQGCGGNWEILKIKSKKMEFKENITFGEACLEGSEIEIEMIDEKKVEVKYYNDLVSKKLSAKATIVKVGR